MEQMEGADARDLQQGIFLACDQSLLCIQRCICLLLTAEVAKTAVNNKCMGTNGLPQADGRNHRVVQGRAVGKISDAEYRIGS
ncbi:hypothetical protein L861_01435 [Litchfieldella anticariensis FP35 = DSM 16096]|uniref:Uncharacterized protein n=1 Tax=Litchfieldella anticariensis (strain DSM 16096 / CECT 5854 / CIP 108499 / LMG 22089 / FP35) TaxID=1121939 RepID=S2KTW0_LITA3|nr:hypothetical protein L861_01435 [Halomonas anticariensis FP35 = DSM 16096]